MALQNPHPSEPSFGAAALAMADILAQWTDEPGGLTCAYLTPAHRNVREQLRDWMAAAGMEAGIDAVGNAVGRWRGTGAERGALMIGSHFDTVRNAGRYDGRLGIILPILVVADLAQQGVRLPFDVEVVGFADEEGVRFATTFLGSGPIAGRFDPAVLTRQDAAGMTVEQAMREAGLDPAAIPALARAPEDLAGYLEIHIEQGPVLLDAGAPLGVVTGIAGCIRELWEVTGTAGHAGTVPMRLRQDAAAAAAEMALAVERLCAASDDVVGTVGQLAVPTGAINVIPGRATFSLDIRAADDAPRDAVLAQLHDEFAAIASRRGVQASHQRVLHSAAAACHAEVQEHLAAAIKRAGAPVLRLPSGAGHDAMIFADRTPTGMLFVRCGAGGVSHNPAETITAEDVDLAGRVLQDFLVHLA